MEKLEMENEFRGDEVSALKAEVRSYKNELNSQGDKAQSLEKQVLQDAPATNIGKEVRLCYLEHHRLRMGKGIGKLGHERIKCGDRAAHRGRPVVDAIICLTGLTTDREVYSDLYGVSPETMEQWKDIPEIVEVTGFRGSLKADGKLRNDFQDPFKRFLEVAKTYDLSSIEGIAAMRGDKFLQRLHHELQNCYDRIVAENPHRGFRG